ncbi:hypothetical protein [Dactylosporangium sp. NPDC000521]|uniref:hypothetical protein n=1 Tax=Dactylosporangium sp. NPDC000521 TaxID=3363975 RepID=UPI00369D33A4
MTVYRINYLARRHPQWTHAAWVPRWRRHWRLAEPRPESATVRRYIQCEVLHDADPVPHDGVASAEYVSLAARHANRAAAGYHRIMRQDEVQVFDSLIADCSFIGSHHVVFGAGTGPFKVVRFLKRRASVAAGDFVRAWRGLHGARMIEAWPAMLSYAQNVAVVPERPDGWGLNVDGSEELWFDALAPAVACATSETLQRIGSHLFTVTATVVTDEVILKDARDPSA